MVFNILPSICPKGLNEGEYNYVVFDENVIEIENHIRFSIKSPIGFYSTVENALDKIQQEKGTKEQFKKMLLNNGAKQAEMDWMGFDELPEKLTKSRYSELD